MQDQPAPEIRKQPLGADYFRKTSIDRHPKSTFRQILVFNEAIGRQSEPSARTNQRSQTKHRTTGTQAVRTPRQATFRTERGGDGATARECTGERSSRLSRPAANGNLVRARAATAPERKAGPDIAARARAFPPARHSRAQAYLPKSPAAFAFTRLVWPG